MSQTALARRAEVPQSTISKIESGSIHPNVSTLEKLFSALGCQLLISAIPRQSFESILRKQAELKVREKVEYLRGTMSLEAQEPDEQFLRELINEEIAILLGSPGSNLWEETS